MSFDTILWVIAVIVFGVVEGVTTALVSVWFAIGAAVAAIVSLFTDAIWVQFVWFVIVSAVAMAIMVPLFRNKSGTGAAPVTNGSPLTIGKAGTVLRAINPGEVGRVRVDGLDWQAVSDKPQAARGKIVVVGVDGANLIVTAASDMSKV